MIFYSHVNEDNRVERFLQQKHHPATVVAITGSGERVLALMDDPAVKRVIAVDVNAAAQHLLELKLAVLLEFGSEVYLKFVGHNPAPVAFRIQCLMQVSPNLSTKGRKYWEKHLQEVGKGILFVGHFERFLARIRPVLLLFLGKPFLRIFSETSFPYPTFPSWRWQVISFFFGQKWVYQFWGNQDTAFVGSAADSKRIPEALNAVFASGKAASCFMLHLIFKGHLNDMREDDLPPSLQTSVLEKIREKLQSKRLKVEYWNSDLLECIKSARNPIAAPALYSVSDILSFVDFCYLQDLIATIAETPENLVVWRSFLRNELSTTQRMELDQHFGKIDQLDEFESTRMYRVSAMVPAGSLHQTPTI